MPATGKIRNSAAVAPRSTAVPVILTTSRIPRLRRSAKPPFYAIKVLPGSFGTFAGLRTDAHARVLNAAGDPVPGLYAVGCDQASVMGGHYPSGGINIGPALTFGYIAGRHCAGATEYENRGRVPQNDPWPQNDGV